MFNPFNFTFFPDADVQLRRDRGASRQHAPEFEQVRHYQRNAIFKDSTNRAQRITMPDGDHHAVYANERHFHPDPTFNSPENFNLAPELQLHEKHRVDAQTKTTLVVEHPFLLFRKDDPDDTVVADFVRPHDAYWNPERPGFQNYALQRGAVKDFKGVMRARDAIREIPHRVDMFMPLIDDLRSGRYGPLYPCIKGCNICAKRPPAIDPETGKDPWEEARLAAQGELPPISKLIFHNRLGEVTTATMEQEGRMLNERVDARLHDRMEWPGVWRHTQ